jgi:hypothetical protein
MGLAEIIENLPAGLFIAKDAAYIVTKHLLIPFIGSQHQDHVKDTFNFVLSQLHIRIENTFGLLMTKWCILQKPLEYSLKVNADILQICALLHNFVIDNKDDNFTAEKSLDNRNLPLAGDTYLWWNC